jgi:hypothetical protein
MELHMDSLFPELALPQPDVLWIPEFLSTAEHESLFAFCRDQMDWQQKSLFWQDRHVQIPRLLAWFGEVDYRYSGLYHPARAPGKRGACSAGHKRARALRELVNQVWNCCTALGVQRF